MATRGKTYEGSAADKKQDKAQARKRGVSLKKWEGSAADERSDRAGQRKMNSGHGAKARTGKTSTRTGA